MRVLPSLALVAMLAAGAAPAHSTNLITNPDFSGASASACISGWSKAGGGWNCDGGGNTGNALADTGASSWISVGDSNVGLSQTFLDVAGTTYAVSAWVVGDQSNGYLAIDGTPLATFGNAQATTNLPWTELTGSFVGTGSDTIKLFVGNDPGTASFTAVSVDLPPIVPEPASFAVLGLGLVGLAALRRRAVTV